MTVKGGSDGTEATRATPAAAPSDAASSGPGPTRPAPLRADARRNRDAVIAAAATAFAAQGVAVPLEEIARDAGVGIATLYRNFPKRENLVAAVYARELDSLCSAPEALLADHPAHEALRLWLARFIAYLGTKRGLAEGLRKMMGTHEGVFVPTAGQRIRDAFDLLLKRAQAEGSIRADVTSQDLMLALFGIYGATDLPDWQDSARRVIGLIYEGMRLR